MPRFFIPSESSLHNRVILAGTDVHHIRNALRLCPGDTLTLVTPRGNEYLAVIRKVEQRAVEVETLEKVCAAKKDSSLEIALAQGLPRSSKMDVVIQKATELGVASIHPFTSARTVPRPNPTQRQGRLARWRRIAMEACKQCGRTGIPRIHDILPLEEVIRAAGAASRKIVLWEGAAPAWDRVFEGTPIPNRFFLLVGPEGGLAEQEVKTCQAAGFIPAGLGRRILRTETAALCFLAVLQYQLGDMRQPERL
ncbi:MAG: 16S rRNA (uracil(1498)-N(3))-methyltransferase [Deltaproteobacteria bacterium]|nr:16S rRNA (uracil(1498)-N(3))-methyltransferase [Deltaproteobacteria bacterium]